jgi:hypothetical protein
MNLNRILKNADAVNKLANRLSKCDKVNIYDDEVHKECGTLAHAFCDLESSFRLFLDVHLPKLMSDNLDSDTTWNVLHDIGEEFRHILYHIKDPKYYNYLFSPEKRQQ